MASSGIRRKVDDLGRVVIPAGMRRTLGIREGDAVEVTVEGERVVLAKPRDACVFCGREEEELTGFRGRLVCRDCLGSLSSVDERLRATSLAQRPPAAGTGGPTAPGGQAPRSASDLPDWDAAPRRGQATTPPAPGPATADPTDPDPATAPAARDAAGRGDRDSDRADRRDSDPAEEEQPERERPRRRPPYDPASTTAW